MDTEKLSKTLKQFGNLSSFEILLIGITIGTTQLDPEIIFRFVSESIKNLQDSQKSKFYNYLVQGNLGKAKSVLSHTKSEPLIRRRVLMESPKYICKLCKKAIQETEIEYLENCTDLFHKPCLITYLENQIEKKVFPIGCPECPKPLILKEIESRIKPEFFEKYQKIEIEYATGLDVNLDAFKSFYTESPKYTCNLCKVDIPEKEIKYLENCVDLFHTKCLIFNLETQVGNNIYPIKCPTCSKPLTVKEISSRIKPSSYERYQKIEIAFAMEQNSKSMECPIPGCKNKILITNRTTIIKCSKCNITICVKCKVKYHDGLPCQPIFKAQPNCVKCPYCKNDIMTRNKGMLLCKCMMQFCSECLNSPDSCHCSAKLIYSYSSN
jgi:IBR domain, a half RING-finger domain